MVGAVTTATATSARRPCAECGSRFAPRWDGDRFCTKGCRLTAVVTERLRNGVPVPEPGQMTPVRWVPVAEHFAGVLRQFDSELVTDAVRAEARGFHELGRDLVRLRAHVQAALDDVETLITTVTIKGGRK